MQTTHHQFAAAQRAYEDRSEPELSQAEEDWLESTRLAAAEKLDKAVEAGVVVTDLTDKFVEVDAEQLFHLMHLAMTGQAAQLMAAVKRITNDCIEELADYQAEHAFQNAEQGE